MAFKLRFPHQFIIIWLSMAAFLHNILMNGANNVIISSLQKEFYLSSRETGIYVSVYDIGSLVSSVLISFASARGSKPRWIAFGMVMLFLGCMISVLPHFLKPIDTASISHADNSTSGGLASLNTADSVELCNYTLSIDGESHNKSRIWRNVSEVDSKGYIAKLAARSGFHFQLKHLLYAANIINGLSSASMTTITFSYIEDIAPHSLSAIYEGIYYAVGAFGVGVGFMITSKCLSIHTDFDRVANQPSWLKPSHPNWIGAWWLPFLIFGFSSLILASVIFIFPRKVHHPESGGASSRVVSTSAKRKKTISTVKQNGHLEQENELHDMSKINGKLKSHDQQHPKQPVEIKVAYSGPGLSEDASHAKNTLLTTLGQTGSLLSINKLGIKSSQYSLSNIDDDENVIDNEHDLQRNPFLEHHRHSQANKVTELDEEEEGEAEAPSKTLTLIEKSVLLLKKPVYLFLIIAAAIEGLLQNSFLAFASLFLEYQYRLASGSASLILGFLSIPPLMIGGLLSGFIVKRLNDKTSSCLKFLSVVLFFNVIVYSGFINYCKEPVIVSEARASDVYRVADNCECDAKIFKPVCLKDSNDTFFQSACLAGCTEYDPIMERYFNCSEAPLTFSSNQTSGQNEIYFTNGLCVTENCTARLVVSYACIALLMFLNALTFLPYLKVTIGCINAKEMNSIGLGMKQFFMNAFGTIPGPILFGSVIDSTCTYWHTDQSNQSVCKMYNNKNFALGFATLGIGFKCVCFFLIILSIVIVERKKRKDQKRLRS